MDKITKKKIILISSALVISCIFLVCLFFIITPKKTNGTSEVMNNTELDNNIVEDNNTNEIISISFNKKNMILNIDENVEETLEVLIEPNEITNKNIIWKSSDENVAIVDSKGKVTAKNCGEVAIVAFCDNKTATCLVQVIKNDEVSNEIPSDENNKESDNVQVQKMNETTTNSKETKIENATTGFTLSVDKKSIKLDLTNKKEEKINVKTNSKSIVYFSSKNRNIATVDKNGLVKAVGEGSTEITISCQNQKIICTVNVTKGTTNVDSKKEEISPKIPEQPTPKVPEQPTPTQQPSTQPSITNIQISNTELELSAQLQRTYQLSATATPASFQSEIAWRSSDENIVKVDNTGKITVQGIGSAEVIATAGGKNAVCKVTTKDISGFRKYYYNLSSNTVSTTKKASNDLGFCLSIPKFEKLKNLDKYPLIIYLHGSGTSSLNAVYSSNTVPTNYAKQSKYAAIFIFPYASSSMKWLNEESKIKGLIKYSISNYNVDANRVGLTGFSNGGTGTLAIGLHNPKLFSSIAAVSPFADYNTECTSYIKNSPPDYPVMLYGSSNDRTEYTANFIYTKLKNKNCKVQKYITDYSHAANRTYAYTTKDVISWMLQQKRTDK